MPSRNKSKKTRKGKKSNQRANSWAGPPPIKDDYAQHALIKFVKPRSYRFPARQIQTGVQSDGSGVIQVDVGLNNPTSATNWSSFGALFDQYRVKSLRVTVRAIPGVATPRPVYVVVDFDNTSMSGINTSTLAMSYANCLVFQINRDFETFIRAPRYAQTGIPEGWIDCNTPISNGRVLILAVSLALSTIYFEDILLEWDLEFRSVR
jgi:hypothetical protein